MTSNSGAALVKKGHPIRGILWGIMFGLGLAVVLVVTKVILLELLQLIIVLVVGIAAGVLWSLFGPVKAPKGPAPASAAGVATEEPPEPIGDDSMIGEGASGDGGEAGESPETGTDQAPMGDGEGDSDSGDSDGDSDGSDSDDGQWRSNS